MRVFGPAAAWPPPREGTLDEAEETHGAADYPQLREAEALLSEGKGLAEVCWAAPQKLIQAL